jgi:D-amino peptidase
MKIFISVDMEGVAGVTHGDHTKLEGTEYQMARKWMTAEANAAVEGAFEAGADTVVVADSHGHMRNLLPDELHEKALLVRGSPRPLTMMEGLDASFNGVFYVGYHSMAGNPTGILSHTYSGGHVFAVRLNGVTVGEPGFNAAIAGYFGVPVALACGDDTLAAEVAGIMPWSERVITKWAISTMAATNLTPKASQKLIKAGAKRAIERLGEMKPWQVSEPVELEAEFFRPINATLCADVPGAVRVDGRTVRRTCADMLEVTKVWRLMFNAMMGDFYV